MVSAAAALRERRLARGAQEIERATLSQLPPPSRHTPKIPSEEEGNSKALPMVPIKRCGKEMVTGQTDASSKRIKSNIERSFDADAAYSSSRYENPNQQADELPCLLREENLAMTEGALKNECADASRNARVAADTNHTRDSPSKAPKENAIDDRLLSTDNEMTDDFKVCWTQDGNFASQTMRTASSKTKLVEPASLDERYEKIELALAPPFRFLDLPSSIRRHIYKIALPIGNHLVPMMKKEFATFPITTKINPAFALMQTCHRIHSETEALLVRENQAYVPIVPGRIYNARNLKIAQDAKYEGEGFITAFHAVESFQRTYFRVHGQGPFIGDRLITAIELYITMSAKTSATLGGQGRHAMVHLDRYHMWLSNNCGSAKTIGLIRTMALDKFTSWTLAWTMDTDTLFAKKHLFRDLIWLKRAIRAVTGENSNIELKVEIHGSMKAFGEDDMHELTRGLTPGSMLWKVGGQ